MKPKKIKVRLIPTGDPLPQPYLLMEEIRLAYHPDTRHARIALAWAIATKADIDGHIVLGKCVRASDLQRELADYDFVILLNKEVWESPDFTVEKKKALLDHELMHADLAVDSEGSMKVDELGRPVWRIRKHDIEEFQAIVARHGCYKGDLERFAETLLRHKGHPLFQNASEEEPAHVN